MWSYIQSFPMFACIKLPLPTILLMKKKIIIFSLLAIGLIYGGIRIFKKVNLNREHTIGEVVDNFNGVNVYYNGGVDNILGRNLTSDGYNLGLKYQCVEFVKRYYYEFLNHKMPDSYGHAKDFYDNKLNDGKLNKQRNLIQYSNPSRVKPKVNDLIVFDGTFSNRFGHVAIISDVKDNEIEIVQQNPGPFGKPREKFELASTGNKCKVENTRVLGWLRKE